MSNDKNEKKTVGIITFHSAHNYGAVLQAYATQTFLQENGYQAKIINYRNEKIDKNFRVFNIDFSNVKNMIRTLIRDIIFFPKNIVKYRNFERFIKEEYKLSKEYRSQEELMKDPPLYDAYLTGSDQVWSFYLLEELENAYTLNFGKEGVKRISYAASAGDSDIVLEKKNKFKEKLQIIDYISVREKETKENLEKVLNKSVELVLDPTLLIDEKKWNEVMGEKKSVNEKYIFVYMIGMHKENVKIANELSKKTGYRIVHFERMNHFQNSFKSEYGANPFHFLSLIKNAEYVVTTSFHATIFSILFEKKFWVVKPPKAGNRISSLLEKLGLTNRMISTLEEFKEKNEQEEIDFKHSKVILEKEKKASKQWLINAIEGE